MLELSSGEFHRQRLCIPGCSRTYNEEFLPEDASNVSSETFWNLLLHNVAYPGRPNPQTRSNFEKSKKSTFDEAPQPTADDGEYPKAAPLYEHLQICGSDGLKFWGSEDVNVHSLCPKMALKEIQGNDWKGLHISVFVYRDNTPPHPNNLKMVPHAHPSHLFALNNK
ncbi:hypothetical protein AAG570_005425 [Ranatra chinensis]|uniref:Uncharacterized protein n=1 Tax=Ranatra chinensis TaxID=642074 RepID=A0ABD0XZZ7_9HEMI